MFNPSYSSSSLSPTDKTSGSGEKDHVKYKGVRLRKWGKWVSEIRLPNSRERIWLGSYDSAEKAARAFDAAQFCLRGRNAKFNFEDSPRKIEIPSGRILSPAEIQEIASQFGNSFNNDEQPQRNNADEEINNCVANDLGSQAMEVETLPVLSNADDWPFSYYDDNIYEPNFLPNHQDATFGMATSSVNATGVPDYNLMLSSLDHMQEDMYMTPQLGNRFYDGSQDELQHVDEHQYYSQHSSLWNFNI
ncbi:OLC1v1030298C1 [Oldenlandia corymbosa var. corymbosa]|uniref:OLC1v1030298C1 n=1 Tax=Oldenlandia corymbosa var. corymbosa TaxID=529605 RepID=A0AAV1CHL2_OLDCO|nr:OLC1v1030298C1 [Oldenlandia corymbosa var. corymbosa]